MNDSNIIDYNDDVTLNDILKSWNNASLIEKIVCFSPHLFMIFYLYNYY
jgi:hypothetical protein